MVRRRVLRTLVAVVAASLLAACFGAPATSPSSVPIPVALKDVCSRAGAVVQVEGRLDLQAPKCTRTDQGTTCAVTLVDPLRDSYLPVDFVLQDDDNVTAPNALGQQPLHVQAADGMVVVDRGLVSLVGAVKSGGQCRLVGVRDVRELDRLAYVGVDLKRVTLGQALRDGLVVASITGDGLTRLDLRVKPQVDINLEVAVAAATRFESGSPGVQDMVTRISEMVYLPPLAEVSVALEASCAEMDLDQPTAATSFTIDAQPANADLVKLFALEELVFYPPELQQAMVWTITDNPTSTGVFTGIEVNGSTFRPYQNDIAVMRGAFEAAGIDPARYAIFSWKE